MLNVVFISQSEKKGRDRAAAVLDRYAVRVGTETWQTPITTEGLSVVKQALKKIATRQVAISCFQKTKVGLVLSWSIGRSVKRLSNGGIPVHVHAIKEKKVLPAFVRVASLLNEISGLAHDLGKASSAFQQKITVNGPLADPVRHEWISYHLLSGLLDDNLSWDDAWSRAATNLQKIDNLSLINTAFGVRDDTNPQAPLNNWRDTLDFLVASHHRLPRKQASGASGGKRNNYGNSHLSAETFLKFGKTPSAQDVEFQQLPDPAIELAEPLRRLRRLAARMTIAVAPIAPTNPSVWIKRRNPISKSARPPVNKDDAGTGSHDNSSFSNHLSIKHPDFWFSVGLIARPALILADHEQSSADLRPKTAALNGNGIFANTIRDDHNQKGRRYLNQTLQWHLGAVGARAAQLVEKMWTFEPPAVSEETSEKLKTPARPGPYEWQNVAASFLSGLPKIPTLILNLAGTGKGKTRMNMKALAILSNGRPLRIASALNLRSLTLQTLDAYKQQLLIPESELAGVIGDKLTARMHEEATMSAGAPSTAADVDDDDNDPEATFTIETPPSWEAPDWLAHALSKKKNMTAVLMAPIVACTTDFLATGADLPRQGNQAAAFIRLMTSDLILDEIDSYEPKALVSVLRLVMYSAMFGRNVVASSATLSTPCAIALWQAWRRGTQLRTAMLGDTCESQAALIDDAMSPAASPLTTASASSASSNQNLSKIRFRIDGAKTLAEKDEDFLSNYRKRLDEISIHSRNGVILRRPRLIPMATPLSQTNFIGWMSAIADEIEKFHSQFNTPIVVFEKEKIVSFGLIRVANVKTAVKLARFLSERADKNGFSKNREIRVCCYHANLSRVRRFYIEKRLDAILNRSLSHDWKKMDGEIEKEIADVKQPEIMFVVVATPVEEIGRDHDFDWAIIEPSSVQSIVQTAGRVNRHRQKDISLTPERANVGVLEINERMTRGEKIKTGHFSRPGYDIEADDSYINMAKKKNIIFSMNGFLDWPHLQQYGLDAGLKFDQNNGRERHFFSELDNSSQAKSLNFATKIFAGSPIVPNHFGGALAGMQPSATLPSNANPPSSSEVAKAQPHWFCDDFYRFFQLRDKTCGLDVSYLFGPHQTITGNFVSTTMKYYDVDKKTVFFKKVSVSVLPSASKQWLVIDDEEAIKISAKTNIQDEFDAYGVSVDQGSPDEEAVFFDSSFGLSFK